MPQFPGGEKAMLAFIKTNLKYPDSARVKGISGRVIVTFVVDSVGKIGRIKVMRGIGSGCDEEAIRVLELMPDWIPGKRQGKPVAVSYTMPFRFEAITQKPVNSKPLNYEEIGFSEALAKAKKSGQLIFIQLESDCDQCNSVADEGLSGSDISALFDKFICIKAVYNGSDYKKIVSDYRIYPNYPSSLIVASDGSYLASMLNKSTNNRNEYIKLAATAMSNEKNPPFKKYEDALTKEKADRAVLRKYIIKLNDNNFNSQDLVEKYAGDLTLKELEDTSELKFLIRTAPIVNSTMSKLIRSNNALFQKTFESIPYEERVRINRKIIARSKEKAIREKDINYLHEVSDFLASTYSSDYREAHKARANLNLEYYQAVKNASLYYSYANSYYNSFIKNLKMDSVCNAEMKRTVQRPDGAIVKGGMLYQTGNQLNGMAFALCELSSDKEHLGFALGFALKLSELTLGYKYPSYIDTYAQILYRLGARKDAIDWQQKAVNLSDSLHRPNNRFMEVLDKMKNGTL